MNKKTAIGETTVSTAKLFCALGNWRYETIVFGGPLDGNGRKYKTLEDALAGHDNMVQRVKDRYSFFA